MSIGTAMALGISHGAEVLAARIWKGKAIVPVNKPSAYLFMVALSQWMGECLL